MDKVLFEIDANPPSDNIRIWSNVSPKSYFQDKDEVLFMIGSIFRLVNIDHEDDGIWKIQLLSCSTNDHRLQSLIQQNKNNVNVVETDRLSFGFVPELMDKFDDAEKFYHHVLNQLSKHRFTQLMSKDKKIERKISKHKSVLY